MLLSRTVLRSDVLWTCLSHALSTEHQEIMGLLLGHLDISEGKTIAHIERSIILTRKDRQKDRVEVSYDHLAMASTVAESLSFIDQSEIRVVGWYHSHPHITVLPSHVDVKTQGQYQALGDFLGLIFSVFDKGRLEICAFQSRQNISGDWERVEVPIFVTCSSSSQVPMEVGRKKEDHHRLLEGLIAMQVVLLNEEREAFESRNPSSSAAHLRGGLSSPQPSDLELLRQSAVYQASIFRLVDLQLYPLLLSMKSKLSSLQQEKAELLGKLEAASASASSASSSGNKTSPRENIEQDGDDGDVILMRDASSSDKALHALLMMVPKWQRCCRAIQIALQGFKARIVASSTNAVSYSLGTEGLARVQRALVSSLYGGLGTRSPWLLTLGTTSAPLLAVNTSVEEDCVEFILAGSITGSSNGISTINLTLKLLGADDMNIAETAKILGAELHRALRLHQWSII